MLVNNNLFFKYLFFQNKITFLKTNNYENNSNALFLNKNTLYYTSLHIKLSTFFYSTQLIDIFAYETAPISPAATLKKISTVNNILVYNFQNCFCQKRFFFFLNTKPISYAKTTINKIKNLKSITELFCNANWLEREVSELNNIFFSGKKDIRNLMLQYGDSSAPFRKSYPSIGLREVYYDSTNDALLHSPVSIQF